MLLRVSSAAIKSTSRRVLSTRRVMSSRFPMGVAHKYSFPFCFIICLFSRLTAGICLSLETSKTAKGPQSRAPSAHPLGFFLIVQGIRCSDLLTCVCMLRYSARYVVPMLFYFCTFSVLLFWRDACMLRYLMRYTVPIRHTAISRSESQARGGRLLVVTLAEPPSAR